MQLATKFQLNIKIEWLLISAPRLVRVWHRQLNFKRLHHSDCRIYVQASFGILVSIGECVPECKNGRTLASGPCMPDFLINDSVFFATYTGKALPEGSRGPGCVLPISLNYCHRYARVSLLAAEPNPAYSLIFSFFPISQSL